MFQIKFSRSGLTIIFCLLIILFFRLAFADNISDTPSVIVPVYVKVEPQEVTVFSSETIATLERVNIKEGDSFKANDLLLSFDCRIQRSDLKKAVAEQELAKSAFKSAEKMKSYGLISELEYVKARSNRESAIGDVDKYTAYVDKCMIKAPFDGAVSELLVHSGETVKPGDPLLKIVSNKDLSFAMQIPSNWLTRIQVGYVFTIDLNELEKKIPSKVFKINPEIDPISKTVKVFAVPVNKSEKNLLPGMSGQATFKEKS